MQGSQKVIDLLNKQLTLELSSMDQYLAHSKMYEDWGLSRLHHKLAHEYEEELDHAKRITERILFLEGTPDTASRAPIKVGENVQEMLENDLAAEITVKDHLKKVIAVCEEEQDYVSREMLEALLDDTEMDHIYWLEQHIGLIKLIGLPNYIQSQMSGGDPT
ncbi:MULTISPECIES: bacterioferritin [Pseudoalteromonas]|uniref:Bacterioferritin n=2 Tax=Pseudoalteromonas TaxID=53246 RepID=A0A0F4QSQ4_9GAMM|nr:MULTISPECIES: bacterioferritin [Pseudoalteromonas]KAF7781688.1 bacterioferritin [Pseudoalteromonas rubra]KJZ09632.1 bacterioferritin [Pseudoalteromonas rubra]MCG7560283.1 bacterioferritin [Pseudoalteromonas sp. McH1-42]MDK1309695.1 bacterioferritin [Pseudoalteromonas sp. R96]MEC4088778.1 bacterioferritin [Pseudoalteromonas rubra]